MNLSAPGTAIADAKLECKDGISALSFAPKRNLLAASCWDGNAFIWDVGVQGPAVVGNPQMNFNHGAPILDTAWRGDSGALFTAGCDNAVKMWTPGQTAGQQVAAHGAPVRAVRFDDERQAIWTGSWDQTVKAWDLRTPNPAMQIQLASKVHVMDMKRNMIVVGCSPVASTTGGAIYPLQVYDSRNTSRPFLELNDKFASCISAVAVAPMANGFVAASVRGRIMVHWVTAEMQKPSFVFRAHRQPGRAQYTETAFPINAAAFHPIVPFSFATAGGDGSWSFWKANTRRQCVNCTATPYPQSLSACTFSNDGLFFAFAVSYDWAMGAASHNPSAPNTVVVHEIRQGTPDGKSEVERDVK